MAQVQSNTGARCWWRSWLRHCATSRKVAGSILDGVIGIFHWHNPSGRTMALGLTQPLIEMSTRNIPWRVKAAGAQGWQLYYLRVTIVLKYGSLILLEPSGPLQARGSAVGWGTALQVGRSRVRFPMVSLKCYIDIILPAALWPWGTLSL